ncbi:6-phospho-3-hexuloisomerase [Peribacillus kribbensis]|uniref:6-phospho-3-hexuloisomerase n=1 Tax=Peribacillus kribbensis TaxID=356658 RepID=UPI000428ECFC|nr:6-phospho-3-hexuloisomerase [Peribacillus kribbensis]
MEASYLSQIVDELAKSAALVNDKEIHSLASKILDKRKIFLAGAGRSGLMAKGFAMRLMHLGLEAYVVGETITPAFEKDDLLIIASGSGETKSLAAMAEKAKGMSGEMAAMTINPDSSIGRMADLTVQIPGTPKDRNGEGRTTIQPMGSLFEQMLLLILDSLVLKIMELKNMDSSRMYGSHANLE